MQCMHIWSISPRRSLPLWVCRGWGSFLVHSELWGWPHLCAELDGNGFFLEFTSFGNFLVKKSEKNMFRKVPILACFLVKNPGGKKGGVKRRILCVKRILLSFPQYLSVGVLILHEVQQCTPNFFHQFDQHPQMLRKNTFYASNWIFFLSEFFLIHQLNIRFFYQH